MSDEIPGITSLKNKYDYRARNLSGRLVTGSIMAEDENKAVELIRARRLFVIDLCKSTAKSLPISLNSIIAGKVRARELSVFCRQLSTLTQAGIPIMQGLNILAAQTEHRNLKHIIKRVSERLASGMSLEASIKAFPEVFPRIFIGMVEAGETSGSIDRVLERLADIFEKEHELREKLITALIYPAVILGVAVLTMVILLTLVIPELVGILVDLDAPIPTLTQMVIVTSNYLVIYWKALLAASFFVILITPKILKTRSGKAYIDKLILRMPVLGPVVRKTIITRFCRSLSTMLTSGVPFLQSMDIAKRIAGNHSVIKSIDEARSSIVSGQGISRPLRNSGVFPLMVTEMMAVGEETGSLDNLLEKVAVYYEREVTNQVSRLSSVLEPLIIVIMGAAVGLIILSIMIPLFSVINNVR